jgi:beta-phosphoglucomutase-like phosphatase (HAD superfamily)|tara:strand:- start:303 stop:515 length:213 start_codon:yes stop_codon:yes gene_type:complete
LLFKVKPKNCLYFGDSYTDYSAAADNGVPFVYVIRSTTPDDRIKSQYMVKNFTEDALFSINASQIPRGLG